MKKEYDVIVVGGGPSGSMAARFASEQGASVLMLEKDRDIGYPVRCGEAVSKAGIEEFIEPDDAFISATIDKFGMAAPDGTEVVLPTDQIVYVLERRIFDYELAKQAASYGAEIITRAYVNGLLLDDGRVCGVKFEYMGEQHELNAKVVIAADGVESRVGRWAGIKTHLDYRDMESCVQVTASNIDVNPNTIYFYFGKDVAPEGYFWVFPKRNKSANIGLGVSGAIGRKKSSETYFNSFMNKHYPDAPILTRVTGGVPSSITLEKISAPGIILVGDAARQVNPLSGGGIVSGMIGGKIGGTIVGEAINKKNLDLILTYDKAWKDRLGKRHEIFDRLKNGIYNFSDEKFNSIAHAFSKVPMEKRTLGNLFKTALLNKPSLLVDIAKVFIFK